MPDFHDLPYVNDDLKNMKIAVQMLNFPKENVFEFKNVSYDKIKEFFAGFLLDIMALSSKLKPKTGVGYNGGKSLIEGLEWERLKESAMNEDQPTDRVKVNNLRHSNLSII